jgi:hypothetical protein
VRRRGEGTAEQGARRGGAERGGVLGLVRLRQGEVVGAEGHGATLRRPGHLGRACPGRKSRRESRRDWRGRCASGVRRKETGQTSGATVSAGGVRATRWGERG